MCSIYAGPPRLYNLIGGKVGKPPYSPLQGPATRLFRFLLAVCRSCAAGFLMYICRGGVHKKPLIHPRGVRGLLGARAPNWSDAELSLYGVLRTSNGRSEGTPTGVLHLGSPLR